MLGHHQHEHQQHQPPPPQIKIGGCDFEREMKKRDKEKHADVGRAKVVGESARMWFCTLHSTSFPVSCLGHLQFLWVLCPLLGSRSAGYAQGHSAVFFSRVDGAEELSVDQVSWIGKGMVIRSRCCCRCCW